jgi:hypothetical protein
MKKAGWILIVISAVVIFYNVVIVKNYNEQQVNDHPIATLFSGGSNLKQGYTFGPPYSGFEIFILAIGIGGIVLVNIGKTKE